MPNEHGDSWFSPKCIEVQRALCSGLPEVERSSDAGASSPTNSGEPANAGSQRDPVRRWEQIFIVKRATTQTRR